MERLGPGRKGLEEKGWKRLKKGDLKKRTKKTG